MRRKSANVVLLQETHGLAATRDPWEPRWTAADVVRVLEPLVGTARKERFRQVLAARLESVTVLLDSPHDPHNGAAVLRSADAFGLQQIHVVPRGEPFAISTTVTRGTEKWVDLVTHESPRAAIEALRARGFRLVSTHPEGELEPEDLANVPRLALVLGNEHDGIREELERASGARVRVTMRGFVESLNLSVSAAILLRAATRDRPGDLSAEDRERLYARGLFLSVSRARQVMDAARDRP